MNLHVPSPRFKQVFILPPFITSLPPPAIKLGIFICNIKMIFNSRFRCNYILEFVHLDDDEIESWTSCDQTFLF